MNHPFHARAAAMIGLISMLLLSGVACAAAGNGDGARNGNADLASAQRVRGSGIVTSETRDVHGFTEVACAASADVTIERGEKESIVVEAEDNILPLIETTVKNGRLTLKTRDNVSFSASEPILVRITARQLDAVSLSGSGSVDAAGIDAKAFAIHLSGTGRAAVSGKSESATIRLSGSGSIDARNLAASAATVLISGSGRIVVNAADQLDAKISGSGTIEYVGDPQVKQRVTGVGRVRRIAQ